VRVYLSSLDSKFSTAEDTRLDVDISTICRGLVRTPPTPLVAIQMILEVEKHRFVWFHQFVSVVFDRFVSVEHVAFKN